MRVEALSTTRHWQAPRSVSTRSGSLFDELASVSTSRCRRIGKINLHCDCESVTAISTYVYTALPNKTTCAPRKRLVESLKSRRQVSSHAWEKLN